MSSAPTDLVATTNVTPSGSRWTLRAASAMRARIAAMASAMLTRLRGPVLRQHRDRDLAPRDTVAPIREVAGRRGGAEPTVVVVRDTLAFEDERDRGRNIERGRALARMRSHALGRRARPSRRARARRTRSARDGCTDRGIRVPRRDPFRVRARPRLRLRHSRDRGVPRARRRARRRTRRQPARNPR